MITIHEATEALRQLDLLNCNQLSVGQGDTWAAYLNEEEPDLDLATLAKAVRAAASEWHKRERFGKVPAPELLAQCRRLMEARVTDYERRYGQIKAPAEVEAGSWEEARAWERTYRRAIRAGANKNQANQAAWAQADLERDRRGLGPRPALEAARDRSPEVEKLLRSITARRTTRNPERKPAHV